MTILRPILLAVAVLATCILPGCSRKPSALEDVHTSGELVVATRTSPTTFYEGPNGPTGIEYDLASRFAEQLGVQLKIITASNLPQLLDMLDREVVHLAAGLTVTKDRKSRVRFGPAYQNVGHQVIYRMGRRRPRQVSDLVSGQLEVPVGSSQAEILSALQREQPELQWQETAALSGEQLLQRVWEKELDYTVAHSNVFALTQRFYPELRVAFDLSKPQPVAWAFPPGADTTLYDAALAFFRNLEASGELEHLIERHYGHLNGFDYVGTRKYMRHILTRLPAYQPLFAKAADLHDVDWRLLAAIGYQESHWNPKAQSPTGVRGIMMLTLDTAKQLGIKNRLDPAQSIRGGAEYFADLKRRLPKRIQDPDRTWLALAAYNIGMGHLEDARVITQKRGGNPDAWPDVKENLPLLSRKKWYQTTKYGYARGWEPVQYVENIRGYYEILVRKTNLQKYADRHPDAMIFESPTL